MNNDPKLESFRVLRCIGKERSVFSLAFAIILPTVAYAEEYFPVPPTANSHWKVAERFA